jgi:hypothetical protein
VEAAFPVEESGIDEEAAGSRPSFDAFRALLGSVVGVAPERLRPSDRLGREVPLDELSLAQLVLAIQDVNPYFELPRQLKVHDITVADLHHFCCVMSAGHLETVTEEDNDR